MKGNQGLEALAALCGGRPKAVDMAGANHAAPGASIENSMGTAPPTTSAPASSLQPGASTGKVPSSETSAPTAAVTSHMLIRQAVERNEASSNAIVNSSCNGSVAMHQQQHPAASAPATAVPIAAPSAVLGASGIGNLTPQQLSQAILAAANTQGGRLDPALAQSLLFSGVFRGTPAGVESVVNPTPVSSIPAPNSNIIANTMQQLVIQQYLQAQANVHQQQAQQQQAQAQAAANAAATANHPQAALLAMTLAAGKAGQQQQHFLPITAAPVTASATSNGGGSDQLRPSHVASGTQKAQQQQQQTTSQQAQSMLQHASQQQQKQQQQQQQLSQAAFTSIQPATTGLHHHAQAIQQQYHYPNSTTATTAGGSSASLPSMIKIAAAGGRILPSTELSAPKSNVVKSYSDRAGALMKDGANTDAADEMAPGSKKQQKRAANRRSAQLSRKRKKQFIEELKEENDDLRRKEQILRAIPDLVVVFDSSGKLGFVSESVGRFLEVSPEKLEGTSFWDLICEDSVRLLKAAFMDSLAAREADSDTAVLGSGVWELRLKNKNSKYMIVTLNGVVHFKGDAPECVCCIRPLGEDEQHQPKHPDQLTQDHQQQKQASSSNHQQLKMDGLESKKNNAGAADGVKKNKGMNRTVSCSDGDASRSSDGSNGTQQSVLNGRHGHPRGMPLSSSEQDDAGNDSKKRNKFRRVMASADDGDSQNSDNSNNNNNLEADGTNNSIRISDGDSNDGIESD